ncbi:hypothetical protein ABT096_23000 [Streptomyces sp. NPDC002561]|uniref:hypothetical protein n=1 Tax=unclassified Streptomyces TaxID=2593676 RepID=UPI00332ABD40
MRYVKHRIIRHPEEQVNVAEVDRQCMAHTGLTGHDVFARRFTDVALVLRVDE